MIKATLGMFVTYKLGTLTRRK